MLELAFTLELDVRQIYSKISRGKFFIKTQKVISYAYFQAICDF